MSKGLFKDRVLEDLRNKVFQEIIFPKYLRDNFDISCEDGSIIIKERKKINRFEIMDIE